MHYQKVGPPRLVGGEGIWTFICADTALFAALFGMFSYYWHIQFLLFAASQAKLHTAVGMINTLALVTSSWLVANAVKAARTGMIQRTINLIAVAMLCGLLFVGIKILEYHSEITAGNVLTTNEFFMFYYVMSGLHLVHVFVGLGALGYVFGKLRASDRRPEEIPLLEAGAAFWHMVDVLWIFLFPLLYLVR